MASSHTARSTKAHSVSADEREQMIAEAAYYLGEQRGFEGGEEAMTQDWLQAERQIDEHLGQALSSPRRWLRNQRRIGLWRGQPHF